jgi:hypothetical protein
MTNSQCELDSTDPEVTIRQWIFAPDFTNEFLPSSRASLFSESFFSESETGGQDA